MNGLQPAREPASSAQQPDPASQLWKDRYRIEKEIGRGGFGVVYLARDQQLLSKPVVIKVLRQDSAADPYFVKKFQREMEALARIDHPGVVGVLDVGETPEGKPFLVMQFVEGATLRSAIVPGGMEFSRAANILRQVCQALGAAHDKGVFHGDLKPENIMLQKSGDREEYVKLIDFGIAAVRDSQVPAKTQTPMVVGTLAYMAPEQILAPASGASDVYALGVIAYEMLTGQRPENSPQGVSVQPRELRPSIPEPAQAAVLSALSYQPEKRPGPREFGDQATPALGGAASSSASLLPALTAAAAPTATVSSSAKLEMAYVLFMDLVSYSTLPMDLQSQRIQELQQIVRSTPEFRRAQQCEQLISLPTGDGMALVFFQNPVAPVQCAVEISRASKEHPELKLRMGVHSGPVYRIADINTSRNVAGGGINLAQRVMDCGDASHILLSKPVADILGQLSDWAPALHDLGDAEVKHGVKVHVVNLVTADAGNANLPEKLKKPPTAAIAPDAVTAPAAALAPLPQPQPPPATLAAPSSFRRRLLVGSAALAAVIVAVALLGPWRKGAPPSRKADQTAFQATATGVVSGGPVEQAGATAPTATPSGPPPVVPPGVAGGQPPQSGLPSSRQSARAERPRRGLAQTTSSATKHLDAAATPANSSAATAVPPQSADASGGGGAPSDPAHKAALQEQQDRMIQLLARGGAVTRSMQRIEQQQNSAGVGMRPDMAAARDSFQYLMDESKSALAAGDVEGAKRHLDLAEIQLEKLEHFLGL